ncbi:hypothetical protein [Pontiella sp.]|uniref:hypothetical protein n=1 Tax=Pontiella sp. TaxID=2837462 RepID=UPI003567551B
MNKRSLMIGLFALSFLPSFGQSVADQLRVAECSFRLYNGPTEVEVIDQMVTMRGFEKTTGDLKTFGSAYHLEFTYKGDAVDLTGGTIEFLDEDKRPLHAMAAEDESRFMQVDTLGHRPNPKTRYIAISLEGIPLRLLDEVVSIRIRK